MQATKKTVLSLLLILLAVGLTCGQQQKINQNWHLKIINTHIAEKALAAESWQPVNLPHTWNNLDIIDPNPGHQQQIGWYQKTIQCDVAKKKQGYRFKLYFEGANNIAEVYVLNQKVGQHIGGYLGFEVDITDYVKANGEATVLVKVDNRYNPELIPSVKSDFYVCGGLTRDVWLKTVPPTGMRKLLVQTPQVTHKHATMKVLPLYYQTPNGKVTLTLTDPNGHKVLTKKYPATDSSWLTLPRIKKPMLWHTNTPNLYTLTASVQTPQGTHSSSTQVGFRWFRFETNGAFYLNGKRLRLRGTHRHEDFAGYAQAMPDSLHRHDMELIKNTGFNFVRLAHYPQDPEVYRACDQLGLLVWDELPWCRGGVGNQTWKNNTKAYFKEQIHQNYNHPSIILWSVGNELYWRPEFENGSKPENINPFIEELNKLAHRLDPTRQTAMRKYYHGTNLVDVFSPSIWAGWYGGQYIDYEAAIDKAIEKYPRFFHAEYGGSSHVGRHSEKIPVLDGLQKDVAEAESQAAVNNMARNGNWTETYICDLFDWHLKVLETHPKMTGAAQWAFKDFPTPLRPENAIPFMNQKGLVTRDGTKKDAWYVFASYYLTDQPVLYIQSHTWTNRYGLPNEKKKVKIYANTHSAELYLNGKSIGKKERQFAQFPAHGLVWDVPFEAGKNTLIAHGYDKNNKTLKTDTVTLTYHTQNWKPAYELTASYKKLPNGHYLITAQALDYDGNLVADYDERIYFAAYESGHLRFDGTPNGSPVIEMANGQASIEFVPEPNQRATIEIRTHSFKGPKQMLIINPE